MTHLKKEFDPFLEILVWDFLWLFFFFLMYSLDLATLPWRALPRRKSRGQTVPAVRQGGALKNADGGSQASRRVEGGFGHLSASWASSMALSSEAVPRWVGSRGYLLRAAASLQVPGLLPHLLLPEWPVHSPALRQRSHVARCGLGCT